MVGNATGSGAGEARPGSMVEQIIGTERFDELAGQIQIAKLVRSGASDILRDQRIEGLEQHGPDILLAKRAVELRLASTVKQMLEMGVLQLPKEKESDEFAKEIVEWLSMVLVGVGKK